jgi:cytochrome c553
MNSLSKVFLAAALASMVTAAFGANAEAGRQKAEQVCAACHGKDGNTPIDPSYPRLAGQHRDFLFQVMMDYKNDRRKNPIMSAQAKQLTRQDLQNLAAYYSSLEGTLRHHR